MGLVKLSGESKVTSRKKPPPKRKKPTKKQADAVERGPTTHTGKLRRDTKESDKWIAELKRVGKQRNAAEKKMNEAIEDMHDAVDQAIAAGVSMTVIAESLGITRQWLYKISTTKRQVRTR